MGFSFCDSHKMYCLDYSIPLASVHTNKFRSEYFPLSRATRQGCPLSLLLFPLAIEPLTISLRISLIYTGITRGEREHKVSLYADDLLLFITNPLTSIPNILSILEGFGKVSRYKQIFSKSVLFPINASARRQSFKLSPILCR